MTSKQNDKEFTHTANTDSEASSAAKTPAGQGATITDFLNAAESYTVNDILADLGEFHKADRAYIFRINREKGIAYNTHEWCAPGVEPQIEYLQSLPLEEIQGVEDAVKKGELVIEDVDGELDHEDALYKILEPQDIHSIILAPLNINSEFAGYIGVDNPRANWQMGFLQTVTSVVLSAKLESDGSRQATEESQILLKKLCEQHTTLFYVNLATDYIHVYEANDGYGDKYSASQSYAAAMGEYVEHDIVEADRSRMRQVTAASAIMERFKTEEAFEEAFDDAFAGKLRHCTLRFIKANAEGTCAVVCGTDVTERTEKERRNRAELEEQFDIVNALASSFLNVYVVNLEDGEARIVKLADDYNVRAVRDVEGSTFPFDAVVSRWARENVHPDDKQRIQETLNIANLRRALAKQNELTGTYRSGVGNAIHNYQYEIRRIGNTNSVVGGFTIIDDIIAEHEEREREQREHAEVVQSISAIYSTIFRADVDTHEYEILGSVPLMAKTAASTGNFDDVKEQIIENFMEPEFHAEMRKFLDLDTLAERLANTNTVTTDYKSTANQWMQARFIAKRRDKNGTAKEVLYVARDITEEKTHDLEQQEALSNALAAAQQANKAKTTFLNSMSHDIRTPMNAIIGFTALAQTHMTNQEQVRDYLAKISTSSTHLLSLINDILDMSRIESGTVKLDEKPVHIPDLLHDLRTMIQSLINSKSQNLYIDTQDVMHEDVITDKLRLNQVLINIVGNAIKFTQPGGDVIIRLVEKPCPTKHYTTLEFSVKDNGIGMSEEFLEHIFDTFTREYSSTVSGEQGTGLGMAITKNIVEMMGGTIKVESEEGKGSIFTVTLDVRLANEPVKSEPIPELLGARALVVDDDLNTCQSVSKMLREIQMRPDWTASGKEAVVRAQEATEMGDEYQVYIIDYLMPDMNGIETVRRIRKVISEEVPIIVLTAYDWADFEAEAREAGVTAFVSKPIFMSELRAVLTRPTEDEATATDEEHQVSDYSDKRILLVEDNELNREIAVALLEETGIAIETAKDGDIAVAAVTNSPAGKYDAILMDIQMPRMDGYTATREIRTLACSEKANIPIVAMTANAFEEDRRKALEAGMNGHIIKPISLKSITTVLDGIFTEKK